MEHEWKGTVENGDQKRELFSIQDDFIGCYDQGIKEEFSTASKISKS